MSKPIVVIGILGTVLDRAVRNTKRWERWRPTLSLAQQPDLIVNRFELVYQPVAYDTALITQEDIKTTSPESDVQLHKMPMSDPWDFEEVYGALYDFARTYPFDPEKEDYLVHITTGTHVVQICLFLLIESHHIPARIVQTSPGSKSRPNSALGTYSIIDLDLSRYDRLLTRFQVQQQEATSFLKSGIETRDARFNTMIDEIEKVAINSHAPILLQGATGVGKSQLAKRIYELKKSRRQVDGPLVAVNCATIMGDGAMSALFGHKRGSFTGALQDRPGLLKSADGGMVFLDEVGELGLDEQAMLLHALEEKRFLPVGSDKETASDFQIICGTNRDLELCVAEGTFREDLLARINLWTFYLPGLRDRRLDVEPNLAYELEKFARSHGRQVTFTAEARQKFLAFATGPGGLWLRNFRDLNASVTRMATLSASGRISVEDVSKEITRLEKSWQSDGSTGRAGYPLSEAVFARVDNGMDMDGLDLFERAQLEDVIAVCQRSRTMSEAGRALFAASRAEKKSSNDADRLRKYLVKFDLEWKDVCSNES